MKARVYLQREKIQPEVEGEGFVDRTTCAPATLRLKNDNGAFYLEFGSEGFVLDETLYPAIARVTIVGTVINCDHITHVPGTYHYFGTDVTVIAERQDRFKVVIDESGTPENAKLCYKHIASGNYLQPFWERTARELGVHDAPAPVQSPS